MDRLLLVTVFLLSTAVSFAQTGTQNGPKAMAGQVAPEQKAGSVTQKIQSRGHDNHWEVSKTGAEQLNKDLAECDMLNAYERKDCRREVFAARNDNLYGEK